MSNSAQEIKQFRDICRVCAKPSNKMVGLFGIRKKGLMLADMLGICTRSKIRQTDRLPQNICSLCLSHLEVSFDFYNQVKSSEDRFQKILLAEEVKSQPMEFQAPEVVEKMVKVEFNEGITEISLDEIPHVFKRKRNVTTESEMFIPEQRSYQFEMHERKMNRLFECFLCKEKLKSFKDTRNHLKRHSEATPFKCKICSMHFSATQFEHHLCKGQTIQCDYCAAFFQTTQSLLDHLEDHKEQHQLHKCMGCSKLFPMLFLLECHRAQHGTIEKPHICNVCGRGFRVNFLLTKHLTTHSDERRKSNECFTLFVICFDNNDPIILTAHLCSTCGMGFKTMGTLRSHAIRHSGIKPIACSKCPKRFFSKADLRKHMDVHSDAKYICNVCGATLSSKRSLDEHRSKI